MRFLQLRVGLLLGFAAVLSAQPPVAPTGVATQDGKGETIPGYNVLQSFELGGRWATVGGDEGMYRSTVNYNDGFRLLSSSLSLQSLDGHGKFFDQAILNTQGLGGDPYESAMFRIEKNRLYRYDMMWRSNEYYNPGLDISYGEHFMNTVRRTQDHDLTLFPQSNMRFFLGYSRVAQSGPGLSTIEQFDVRGDEFPIFANIHNTQNEYRLGAEAKFLGFRLNVLHGWEDFRQDSPMSLTSPSQGNNLNDATQLNSFQSTAPYHGTSPYWRVALFREGKKYWAMNARFSYVAGSRDYILNESTVGLDRIGASTASQVFSFGNGQRPAATGNFTFSLFPATMVTLTNQTSVYNIRMSGENFFSQLVNGAPATPTIAFNDFGILTIANSTDLQIRVRPWLMIHGGYEYSDRRITAVEDFNLISNAFAPARYSQTNLLHTGNVGFRIKPAKAFTLSLDGELGRADKPIYPISDKDYHALKARAEYRRKTVRFTAFARSDYNTNSNSLTSFASHSRQYGADVSWVHSERFSLDAGYSRMHLDTLGGISYFVARTQVNGDQSYYVSNIHTVTVMAHFVVHKRADVLLGYNHVQDTGDGRATAVGSGLFSTLPALQAAQTFPLRFLSPEARLSFRLAPKLRWNAGYQYYGYREDFATNQNYRAHTGYSSVSFSF
ncbi:MAG TPA: hypothetical protein VGN17_31585 [Bryobacteraceae bacterium]